MVAQLFEVTVILTILGVAEVVPVIEKLLMAVFTSDSVCVKNGEPPLSLLADTSIVTPPVGRPAVIFICKGKLGPGAAGSVLPLAGVVVTCKAVSEQLPLSLPPFPQEGVIIKANSTARLNSTIFFMMRLVGIDNKKPALN